MKLIFLHQAKAGGATLRNLLNTELRWLCLDDVAINTPTKDVYDACMKADIIYSMGFSYSVRERLGNFFDALDQESTILTHVRSPIDLFESEWRYEIQKGRTDYASTHLPHDPIFNRTKIESHQVLDQCMTT